MFSYIILKGKFANIVISYKICTAKMLCKVVLLRHFGVLVMTNHHTLSYILVPPEIAVLFTIQL